MTYLARACHVGDRCQVLARGGLKLLPSTGHFVPKLFPETNRELRYMYQVADGRYQIFIRLQVTKVTC